MATLCYYDVFLSLTFQTFSQLTFSMTDGKCRLGKKSTINISIGFILLDLSILSCFDNFMYMFFLLYSFFLFLFHTLSVSLPPFIFLSLTSCSIQASTHFLSRSFPCRLNARRQNTDIYSQMRRRPLWASTPWATLLCYFWLTVLTRSHTPTLSLSLSLTLFLFLFLFLSLSQFSIQKKKFTGIFNNCTHWE